MTERRSHSFYTLSFKCHIDNWIFLLKEENTTSSGFNILFPSFLLTSNRQSPKYPWLIIFFSTGNKYVHLWSWSQVPLNKIYLNFTKVYTIIHKNQFQNSFFKSFNSQDLIVNSPLPLLHIFQLLVIRIWC